MNNLSALTSTSLPTRTNRSARFARYCAPDEPPVVDEVADDAATLIDRLFLKVAECSSVPSIAAREVIENLAHADFEGACVSVLDGGATVRVSDCGPGIEDKDRAMQPGFSTATESLRRLVRGVGSGLPVTAGAMRAVGGTVEIDDNLQTGTVVTLRTPVGPTVPAGQQLSEQARAILALLMELGPSQPDVIAAELEFPTALCGRELVLLEHRRLVERTPEGDRVLTDRGTELLTTLF